MNAAETNHTPVESAEPEAVDYSFVPTTARIAVYDDLLSAPRVHEVSPGETHSYIETLSSLIYEQGRQSGGSIPYTVIREVSENFIHAQFQEITVSVLDHGNTIRFADQGPGIPYKDRAQQPGFTSAIEPMKRYIRGVGSGLPLVREYLEISHGTITIEDNLGKGSVVTISLQSRGQQEQSLAQAQPLQPTAAYPYPATYQPQGAVPSFSGAPQGTVQSPTIPAGSAPYGGYPPYEPQPATYADPRQMPSYDPYNNQVPASPVSAQPSVPVSSAQDTVAIATLALALNEREQDLIKVLYNSGVLGVTELGDVTSYPQSSIHSSLKRLKELGLVEYVGGSKKRTLTTQGAVVAQALVH